MSSVPVLRGPVLLANTLPHPLLVNLQDHGRVYTRLLGALELTALDYDVSELTAQTWSLHSAGHLRVASETQEILRTLQVVPSFFGRSSGIPAAVRRGYPQGRSVVRGGRSVAAGHHTVQSRAQGRGRTSAAIFKRMAQLRVRGRGRLSATWGVPPFDVTNCVFWGSADSLVLVDGVTVPSFPNRLVGATNAFLQGTDALRPIFKTGLQNGKPALRFVRANSNRMLLDDLSGFGQGAFSVFVVLKSVVAADDGANSQLVFDTSIFDDLSRRGMSFGSSGAFFFRGGPGYIIQPSVIGGQVQCISGIVRGAGSECLVDGANAVTANIDASNGAFSDLRLGGATLGGVGNYLNSDLYEIIWFNGDVGATKRDAVIAYLMGKYAL